MNINTIHVPERLPGESFDEYRARRRWSRLFADQARPVTALPMQHRVDAPRALRRKVVRLHGIRQYKRNGAALTLRMQEELA